MKSGCGSVLIVGMHYAPEHTGNAPYTEGAANFLSDAGWRVEAFTGVPHYPAWRVHRDYIFCFRRRETREGVRVRRLRHFVPRRQSALRRALMEISFALQVITARPEGRPDVILTVIPTLLSGLAAKYLAARYRVPLIVWMQDSASEAAAQTGIPGGARLAGLLQRIERLVLRHARDVIAISPHFQELAARAGVHDGNVHLIRNWTHVHPPGEARAAVRSAYGWGPDEVIALHTGNMGLKQGLENVVNAAALAQSKDRSVRFVLMGAGNQLEELRGRANQVEAIDILAPVDSRHYTSVLAAADILLINERPGVLEMSLPSKLTSYLVSGRPVIAAVEVTGATALEVQRSGAGLLVPPGDPQGLLDAIQGLASNVERSRALGRNGAEYAARELSPHASLSKLEHVLCAAIRDGNRVSDRD
jgi:glycosyltransferase involved in cell wall biosynthesis